jgi:hypothetical protein
MKKILDINGRILEKKNERNINRRIKVIDHSLDRFFQIHNVFVREYIKVLGPMAAVVYMGLKDHAGSDSMCWPSVKHLSVELGMSSRTVIRGVADLERHGIIAVDRKHRDHNIYELLKPRKWKKLYYTKVVSMRKASGSSLEAFRELND